jgi:hypothetical protein
MDPPRSYFPFLPYSVAVPPPLYAGQTQIRVTLAAILASCPKEVNENCPAFENKTVTTAFG